MRIKSWSSGTDSLTPPPLPKKTVAGRPFWDLAIEKGMAVSVWGDDRGSLLVVEITRTGFLTCQAPSHKSPAVLPILSGAALSSFHRRGRGFTLINHQSLVVGLILYPFTVYKSLSRILSFYVPHSDPEIWKDRTVIPIFRNKGRGWHRENISWFLKHTGKWEFL